MDIDESAYPSPVHFRIKLPHQGFGEPEYIERNYNNLPPTVVASFIFKECKGDPIVTYYDTTIYLYLDPNYGQVMRFSTVLDSNTTDSNCVIRTTYHISDIFLKQYPYLGIEEVEKPLLSIYPNPVTASVIHLETVGISAKIQQIVLYGLEGKRIAVCGYNASQKLITLPPQVAAGNYFLELLFTNGQRERRQIVVE